MSLLEVKNLGISFGGLRAVDGFHISIEKGQLYGLIGPNGAGKTTVFNMLTGVYTPNDGSITLDGVDITGKKTIDINKAGIARTFQNIRLFKDQSVLDNVKIGLHNQITYSTLTGILRLPKYHKAEKEMNEKAMELLKVFDLEKEADFLASNLPYGKQRKLEIARALATEPKLLLLDEHTAALDPKTAASVMDITERIVKENHITTLMITHNMKQALEYGNKTLQLACKKAANWHVVYKALQEGQVAIVLMNHNSIFTNSQHFIVLAGINENGKIIVNDSNRDNYDFWQLKKGFEEGFNPEDILLGYDGAWIYDKSAMPEEPFIYYEETPERGEPRYADIELSQDDIKLLAKVVWVEAQGECAEGQQAVAEVALNRIASDSFPDNLHDVIYGQGQFRSVPRLDKAEPFQAQYEAIERAIYGPYILPKEVVYFATKPTNSNIWGQIGGHIFCYGNDYVAAAEES